MLTPLSEGEDASLLNRSRRLRIAGGSERAVRPVKRLLEQSRQTRELLKRT